jgi:hypothetical protein
MGHNPPRIAVVVGDVNLSCRFVAGPWLPVNLNQLAKNIADVLDGSYKVLSHSCRDLCAIGSVICAAYFDIITIDDVFSVKFPRVAGRVRSKLPVLARSTGNDLVLGCICILCAAICLKVEFGSLKLGANACRTVCISSVGIIGHFILDF